MGARKNRTRSPENDTPTKDLTPLRNSTTASNTTADASVQEKVTTISSKMQSQAEHIQTAVKPTARKAKALAENAGEEIRRKGEDVVKRTESAVKRAESAGKKVKRSVEEYEVENGWGGIGFKTVLVLVAAVAIFALFGSDIYPSSVNLSRPPRSPTPAYDPTIITQWNKLIENPLLSRTDPSSKNALALYPQVYLLLKSGNPTYKDVDLKDVKMEVLFSDPLIKEKLDLIQALLDRKSGGGSAPGETQGSTLKRRDMEYGYQIIAIANRRPITDEYDEFPMRRRRRGLPDAGAKKDDDGLSKADQKAKYVMKFITKELKNEEMADIEDLESAVKVLEESKDPKEVAKKFGVFD